MYFSCLIFFGLICISTSHGADTGASRTKEDREVANFAASAANKKIDSPYLWRLYTVSMPPKQYDEEKKETVYKMNFRVKVTVCKKSEVDYEELDCCEDDYSAEKPFYTCVGTVRRIADGSLQEDWIFCANT